MKRVFATTKSHREQNKTAPKGRFFHSTVDQASALRIFFIAATSI